MSIFKVEYGLLSVSLTLYVQSKFIINEKADHFVWYVFSLGGNDGL